MLKKVVVFMILSVVAFISSMSGKANPATAVPTAAATVNVVGSVADMAVSPAEIASAQTVIGDGLIGVVACTQDTEYHKKISGGGYPASSGRGLHRRVV